MPAKRTAKKGAVKRKAAELNDRRKKKKSSLQDDFLEEIDSDEAEGGAKGDEDFEFGNGAGSDDDAKEAAESLADEDPYDRETADERRVRLAKEYISRIEADMSGSDGDEEDGEEDGEENEGAGAAGKKIDPIAQRLHTDAMKAQGKFKKAVAAGVRPENITVRPYRGHRYTVTAVVISNDETTVYSR
jgi:ribosomal RNA-processing protein 9